jgi:DNA-binding beta-propeller fold protein YncE
LVSIQELPDLAEMCLPGESARADFAGSPEDNLFAALQGTSAHAASARAGDTVDVTRPPVRTIRDTYPIYSSVAVDNLRDEVVLQDTNLFGIKIFNRLENTPSGVEAATPKRVIEGPKTQNEYNNGLSIDPQTGNIHSVAMDTADNMIVFSHDAQGDVPPVRKLSTPHRNFASAIDDEKGEVFITIQYPPKVMVYRKDASGSDRPLRVLEGEHTGLYDAHGLAIDVKKKLMFVGNWGNASDYRVAGSGRFYPPSITVYPLDASGDTAPLRVIQGPKTQLDWFGGMSLDPDNGNLYVANDVGNAILVFKETDQGNVAPSRIIKGQKTGLSHPAGISVDTKNKEFWVSNMGNSSATCYSLTANGDATPVRTIRSAPAGRVSLKFGKPQAVAYDSKREEYLVPN